MKFSECIAEIIESRIASASQSLESLDNKFQMLVVMTLWDIERCKSRSPNRSLWSDSHLKDKTELVGGNHCQNFKQGDIMGFVYSWYQYAVNNANSVIEEGGSIVSRYTEVGEVYFDPAWHALTHASEVMREEMEVINRRKEVGSINES